MEGLWLVLLILSGLILGGVLITLWRQESKRVEEVKTEKRRGGPVART